MIQWSSWNAGAKTIFVAACIAVVSMLMNWVDIGIATRNGLSQGACLMLVLWLYPVIALLRGKPIMAWLGGVLGGLSALMTLVYIGSKQIEIYGRTVNVAAMGSYMFLLASVALIVGCFMYKPARD